jgi:hypothetical protein
MIIHQNHPNLPLIGNTTEYNNLIVGLFCVCGKQNRATCPIHGWHVFFLEACMSNPTLSFEFDFRVESITRSQAEAILESIQAHVMELGAVMAGGFQLAQDEAEVPNGTEDS